MHVLASMSSAVAEKLLWCEQKNMKKIFQTCLAQM